MLVGLAASVNSEHLDCPASSSRCDNSATTADNDYASASGALLFAPGETSKTISVSVNGDKKYEPDELFQLIVSNVVGARVNAASGLLKATAKIVNDDLPTWSPTLFTS